MSVPSSLLPVKNLFDSFFDYVIIALLHHVNSIKNPCVIIRQKNNTGDNATMKDNDMRKSFGDRLKALRKQKRWTQKELAGMLEIGLSQFNKYESGMHIPPIEKLIQLSDLFDTTVDYLVKGTGTDMKKLHNSKLLKRFYEIEHFDIEEQNTVLQLLDAMIMKNKMTGVISMDNQ
jgi:transcriptional regulator with XRE-family HTH domain